MVEMPRKNRRKRRCPPAWAARKREMTREMGDAAAPEHVFTAMELEFFRRGDDESDCSETRTIWTEVAG
jgi:hypothetical protein